MEYITPKASYACIFTALISSTFTFNIQAAAVNDLIITEIMANPLQVSDGNGEWFELFNPTPSPISLAGITLSDDGSNLHAIADDAMLWVNPGQYFVMAKNADINTNGGFIADYEYANFTLGNSGDQIVFANELNELLRFHYSASFDQAGQSMELISLPMLEDNFGLTNASLHYGLGDIGTPGMAGLFTPQSAQLPSPIPLPAAVWLFGSGLIGMAAISRRRQTRFFQ